ncbi:asparagine synthase (glutamine-hydrolyzing) [Desulfovibrio sp. X2]|uniref:asparagine synthase (glutamine-hydrolyzing) n=1 Tax=Desulfovibrio sp. X2 TaxID=941449 RepID=UPI0003589321|nr:asparagine synthase (glutamine-hydrolyzing) [Desulfovibrio sp. X2]EPR37194.1 asparagine synthase (glutamine-hydrolyzing) [Desulfovibrio sp. X2]
MCGIAGIIAPPTPDLAPRLQAMAGSLRHRGPDGVGFWSSGQCHLAHTRLAIVDIEGGAQPLRSADDSLATVFNGELYGYSELRERLDYPFRTRSDTEVLLAMYEAYGTDMLAHLPGMFAFAIWDERRKRLFCARDRFGEKPFYYATDRDGRFLFASEVKAVLAAGLLDVSLDAQSLCQYLVYSYLPEGRSMYREIAALPPGCAMTVGPEGVKAWRYWDLPAPAGEIGGAEAAEELAHLLDSSVQRCLVADVEVGVLLSGGLDSTTLAVLAARHRRDIRTFSFGFEGWRNELPYAREVSAALGSNHVELLESDMDLPAMIESLSGHYDEPFGDLSAIPTLSLCSLVRRHLKVALGGDGADELMGGYVYWYLPLVEAERAGGAAPGWSAVAERHWRDQQIYFGPEELAGFGLPLVPRPTSPDYIGSLDDAMRLDLRGFLAGDILKKVDRASMAHGLELRLPFLDWPLAEFLVALPWRLKLDDTKGKLVLRNAFERLWPESVRTRGKQGFSANVDVWLQREDVLPLRRSFLADKNLAVRGLFPDELVDACANDVGYRGWVMLVLSMWLQQVTGDGILHPRKM